MSKQSYDWTFTTRFMGELISEKGQTITPTITEEQIPVQLLTRPDPILFYDEVVLFEDELADNGSAIVTVKVRVMPTCIFLLQRFFLRVDDVLFRVIDTRVFHQFGKSYVLREYQEKAATHEQLVSKNEVVFPCSVRVLYHDCINCFGCVTRSCYQTKENFLTSN